jgi:hypothetical protein
VQAKGIHNTFNNSKKIPENFPNLGKVMPIQKKEVYKTPTQLTKIEVPHDILTLKQ